MISTGLLERFKEIRVSITERCNMNCFYCKREGIVSTPIELSTEQWIFLLNILKELTKARKIKFSGGEPLLRNDIPEIIKNVKDDNVSISISTNGLLLNKTIDKLYSAGLDELVVSLDSLKKVKSNKMKYDLGLSEIYKKITKEYSFQDLRLDMVVTKRNLSEIENILEFCNENGINLRYLELQTFNDKNLEKEWIDLKIVEKMLIEKGAKFKKFNKTRFLKLYKYNDIIIFLTYSICEKGLCGCCILGKSHFRVLPNGNFQPCVYREEIKTELCEEKIKESVEKYKEVCEEILDSYFLKASSLLYLYY